MNSVLIVKAGLDKTTNTLMTKSQGILDRIKAAPDSASSKCLGKPRRHLKTMPKKKKKIITN